MMGYETGETMRQAPFFEVKKWLVRRNARQVGIIWLNYLHMYKSRRKYIFSVKYTFQWKGCCTEFKEVIYIQNLYFFYKYKNQHY